MPVFGSVPSADPATRLLPSPRTGPHGAVALKGEHVAARPRCTRDPSVSEFLTTQPHAAYLTATQEDPACLPLGNWNVTPAAASSCTDQERNGQHLMYRPQGEGQGDDVSPLSSPSTPQSGALMYSKASVSTCSVKSPYEPVVAGSTSKDVSSSEIWSSRM